MPASRHLFARPWSLLGMPVVPREPSKSVAKRTTVVAIDLQLLKEPWLAWCRRRSVNPSEAFRDIVRRLTAAPAAAPAPLRSEPPGESRERRVWLALTPSEHRAVTERAATAHLTIPKWLAGLMRSHLTREPQFGGQELEALIESTTQLRYIGRNLNQVAKGLNASPHERLVYKVELIERLEEAIKGHTSVVSRLLAANVERWRVVE